MRGGQQLDYYLPMLLVSYLQLSFRWQGLGGSVIQPMLYECPKWHLAPNSELSYYQFRYHKSTIEPPILVGYM